MVPNVRAEPETQGSVSRHPVRRPRALEVPRRAPVPSTPSTLREEVPSQHSPVEADVSALSPHCGHPAASSSLQDPDLLGSGGTDKPLVPNLPRDSRMWPEGRTNGVPGNEGPLTWPAYSIRPLPTGRGRNPSSTDAIPILHIDSFFSLCPQIFCQLYSPEASQMPGRSCIASEQGPPTAKEA